MAKENLIGRSHDKDTAGVKGENTDKGPAIHDESVDGRGIEGINKYGVRAHSESIAGLCSSSAKSRGLEGWGRVMMVFGASASRRLVYTVLPKTMGLYQTSEH